MNTRARAALALLAATSALFAATGARAAMKVGQNLERLNYYTCTPVFVNSMKHARSWMTRQVGGNTWESKQEGAITANADGYPTVIPFSAGGSQHFVHTQIPVYENGAHRLTCVGKGTLKIKGPGVGLQTYNVNGSLSVTLTASGAKDLSAFNANSPIGERNEPSYWYLEIHTTNSSDPIRDIRLMRPGFHNSGRDVFDPVFLSVISPYHTLRFLNWQRANNSARTEHNVPSNRKSYYTQATSNGVADDHIIDLANQTGKHIWLTVPHLYTSNGRHQMAHRYATTLNSGIKCYVEYSNEVWNPKFAQNKWVDQNVSGNNLPQKYGKKATEVFGAFKGQFNNAGKGGQVVRVLAGQNGNPWTVSQALVTGGATADAVAVAPYFGTTYGTVPNPLPTLEQMATDAHTRMTNVMANYSTVRDTAQANNKLLLCYEGGQHYVAGDSAVNNHPLSARMLEFNRHWRMRNLYRNTYLNEVNSRGTDMFAHFTVTDQFTKWGSWGSMEWSGQTIGTWANHAQKEWAIRDWMAANP